MIYHFLNVVCFVCVCGGGRAVVDLECCMVVEKQEDIYLLDGICVVSIASHGRI